MIIIIIVIVIIFIIIINFFTGFLRVYRSGRYVTYVIRDILPEICVFFIGFSCTVWTIMRYLAGSLVDGVLADTILFFPCPPDSPTNIRKVRGPRKKYGN